MPPNEDEMYSLICKDRFDKIDEGIKGIDNKLFGSDGNGLSGRLIKVEGTVQTQEGRWKWLFRSSTALVIIISGKLVYDGIVFLKSLGG